MGPINYIYAVDTEQFSLFLDLVKSGSFSRVAKNHFRTQPAVSISIKKLEAGLGVKLFKRDGRKITLTPEGEVLEKQITVIHRLINELRSQATLLSRHPKGHIQIATIYSVGLYELGDTIKWFIKKYRNIRFDLRYEQFQKAYDLVEEKEVDFGVVAYPAETRNIEVVPLAEDEMVIIASPSSGLDRYPTRMSLEEINGMNFVAFSEDAPTRAAIDEVFKKMGIRVSIRFENENIETIKKAVEVGLGVSMVPFKSVEADMKAGHLRIIKIKGQPLKRPIGIIKLRNRPLSPAADFFINELFKHY